MESAGDLGMQAVLHELPQYIFLDPPSGVLAAGLHNALP